jgi:hypothetical protein
MHVSGRKCHFIEREVLPIQIYLIEIGNYYVHRYAKKSPKMWPNSRFVTK